MMAAVIWLLTTFGRSCSSSVSAPAIRDGANIDEQCRTLGNALGDGFGHPPFPSEQVGSLFFMIDVGRATG
jgi:hypothetical protein